MLQRLADLLSAIVAAVYGSSRFLSLPEVQSGVQEHRYTKQRTEAWFTARADGSISSSDLAAGLGYFSVSRAREIQQQLWNLVSKKCFIIATFTVNCTILIQNRQNFES